VVDSQSVRSASKGACADPVGYDAGKKVKGVKYQILVDTLGLMLNIVVHPADIQDRDGAALDKRTRQTFPFIEIVYADGAIRVTRRPMPSPAPGNSPSSNAPIGPKASL
jgi:Transposase DDE domain